MTTSFSTHVADAPTEIRQDQFGRPTIHCDGYMARIELDSLSPISNRRLTTVVLRYPRFVHSELMTHRAFARNSASSRAIPYKKMRQQIVDEPVIPLAFWREQSGMVGGEPLEGAEHDAAVHAWLSARTRAVEHADHLHSMGVHKSLCNRITEPWMWITVIVTATEFANFFRLRCHPDAEVHIQRIAYMLRNALELGRPELPKILADASWHLPFVTHHDLDVLIGKYAPSQIASISAARCARVSYLTHDGQCDPDKDLQLAAKLENGSGFGHWSPYEHVACADVDSDFRSGPFVGWRQLRKTFINENAPG